MFDRKLIGKSSPSFMFRISLTIKKVSVWVFLALAVAHMDADAATPVEYAGSKDHPLISRFNGAILVNVADENYASVRVPLSPGRFGAGSLAVFDKSVTVEGRVSSYFYIAPKGRAALEVFRNYQQALTQSGFVIGYSCEMKACDDAKIKETFASEVVEPRKWSRDQSNPVRSIDRDVRFLSARASKGGKDVYVMLYVAEPNSIWEAPAVVEIIAEPQAMQTGNVTVNIEQLQKGLIDDGKIALYGIYFDTGRAEIRPESKSQLDEMAKLLNANKSLKVIIVGHTDNQGGIDANLTLSQRRAEAVVSALTTTYRIDASRLRSRGVANFAPVSSNRTEAGRAKNRRVELVEQ